MGVIEEYETLSRPGKVLFNIIRWAAMLWMVQLAALFITTGELFESGLMLSLFSWTSLVLIVAGLIYLVVQFKPVSTEEK